MKKRKQFYDLRFGETENNPKKFWKNINHLIYNKNPKKQCEIEIRDGDGKMINTVETVNKFNKYFINLPKTVLETQYGNLNELIINSTINQSSVNSLFLEPTDETEIMAAINKLKNTYSSGIDERPAHIYKNTSHNMSKIMAFYVNNSFESGQFPDELKTAKIVPIHKNIGSKFDIKMYRPISILNIESKIFESCMYDRLYSFLEGQNFFKTNQFGFVKKSNTNAACITLIDKIQRALNENRMVCTVFLDVSKAFDCVDRKILMDKLEKLGIRGIAYNLFNSYINGRSQIVQIGKTKSEIDETKFNIAQGSKLGPLLFLVQMNDIFTLDLNGFIQLYADDSSITYVADDLNSMKLMIGEDLVKINKWFKNNLLVLNEDKTEIIFYNTHRNELSKITDLKFENTKINRVTEHKYLGLTIDSNLTWDQHINKIMKKVKPYVGVFRRISTTQRKCCIIHFSNQTSHILSRYGVVQKKKT